VGEFVSVHTTAGHVYIASDGGRVCRPLLIVEHGNLLVTQTHLDALKANKWTFNHFLTNGLVEYLDVNEENNSYIGEFIFISVYMGDRVLTTCFVYSAVRERDHGGDDSFGD
jgi:DNA-directed RNA polymerase beta subunit